MASLELFKNIPPFPDNVPIASMSTIPLSSLTAGDEITAKSLLEACQELGFFFLDLRGDTLGETLTREIDALFDAARGIMALPDHVKDKYLHDPPKSFLGFKPRGTARIETQEPDRFQWYNLGQDGLLGNSPLQPVPDLVELHRALFTSFLRHGQKVVFIICQCLAQQLGLPASSLTDLQRPTEASGTVVRLIKAEAAPNEADLRTSMIHHTDFGTVTLLANVLGGLQVLKPGSQPTDEDSWLWVCPRPGCLIVNLGDAMVQWTGGVVRSNVHRIRYPPGEQRFLDRYSLGLLVRPERHASMKRLTEYGLENAENVDEDSTLTAWEWEVKKMMGLKRSDTDNTQSKD